MDEEVACVDAEEGREEAVVGDFEGVDGVAVSSGASVDADVGSLGGGKAGKNAVSLVRRSSRKQG